jgi:hypothetical protein
MLIGEFSSQSPAAYRGPFDCLSHSRFGTRVARATPLLRGNYVYAITC